MRTAVIAPSLIYGRGRGLNPHSIQVPWLIALAKKSGVAKHIGSGENRWSNVHIDDLVTLYRAAIDKAPAGAFYFAENGENSMRETCEAVSRMLGFGGRTQSMTVEDAAAEWGEGPANDTMGSNSRVRARRARARSLAGLRPALRSSRKSSAGVMRRREGPLIRAQRPPRAPHLLPPVRGSQPNPRDCREN